MAFTDKSPSAWLGAGYNATSGKIELNTNDAVSDKLLPELTDSEADENSGDIGRLLYGLVDGVYAKLQAKNEALLAGDRPTRFTFSRSSSVNEATGLITRNYNFSFTLAATGLDVASEP